MMTRASCGPFVGFSGPRDTQVRTYASPLAFLAEHDPDIPGCAILDLSMPGLDGLELQASLAAGTVPRQVIFLTGTGTFRPASAP